MIPTVSPPALGTVSFPKMPLFLLPLCFEFIVLTDPGHIFFFQLPLVSTWWGDFISLCTKKPEITPLGSLGTGYELGALEWTPWTQRALSSGGHFSEALEDNRLETEFTMPLKTFAFSITIVPITTVPG